MVYIVWCIITGIHITKHFIFFDGHLWVIIETDVRIYILCHSDELIMMHITTIDWGRLAEIP